MSPRRVRDLPAPPPAEDGQALAEFALLLPLLIILMAGITYAGGLLAANQNLAIAARHAARRMAIDATQAGLKNSLGQGGVAKATVGREALDEAWPRGGLVLAGVKWGAIGVEGTGYAAAYTKTGRVQLPAPFGSMKCGVGVALYGATAVKSLRSDLSPMGKIVKDFAPGGGLANLMLPSLSAASVMPAELPIHGKGGGAPGVLELNPWISKVVGRAYSAPSLD